MMGSAAVIGASGGIGAALADTLEEEGNFDAIYRLSRRDAVRPIDITDEESVASAAAALPTDAPLSLVIVATGMLHGDRGGPEKSMAALDADWMMANYRVNCIGPALVAKHFLPIMPRTGRSVFAALSARVGSISDNRLGGWHSYRASKAALNMMIRTLAVERARVAPSGIVVALHPGTVDTPLSAPFQGNVAPGTLFAPDRAALQLLDVIDGLKPADSGRHFAWDGSEIPG